MTVGSIPVDNPVSATPPVAPPTAAAAAVVFSTNRQKDKSSHINFSHVHRKKTHRFLAPEKKITTYWLEFQAWG